MLGEWQAPVERIGTIARVDAGLVVIDKPAGLTSHDVVARLRRILRTRKIGHAGTLDPMATGVLVCGVERGTKLLGHLALDTKAYTATIRLGAATTTDDAEGEVLSTADPTGVTDAAVAAGVAARLRGRFRARSGGSPRESPLGWAIAAGVAARLRGRPPGDVREDHEVRGRFRTRFGVITARVAPGLCDPRGGRATAATPTPERRSRGSRGAWPTPEQRSPGPGSAAGSGRATR